MVMLSTYSGYDWIGWSNDSTSLPGTALERRVEINFKFDRPRNFTAIRLHCNNLYSLETRVFRLARIWFSLNSEKASSSLFETVRKKSQGAESDAWATYPDVEFSYKRDSVSEFARTVPIAVPHSVGRFVKLQLFFDDRWMMISEVQFVSGKLYFIECIKKNVKAEKEKETKFPDENKLINRTTSVSFNHKVQ